MFSGINKFTSKKNILSYIGSIIFAITFMYSYSHIDNNWYEYRDDGVITMSAARNLIDEGFIGVSVSGPIVEVSSSPIQLFTFALVYLLTNTDYTNFAYWQTVLSTCLIGFIFIRFFIERPLFSIIITTFSATGLTYFYPFFEWHASGMENSITHVLFLSTIYILHNTIKEKKINYLTSIIIFFASISRIDSIYYIAIILLIYSIYWFMLYDNLEGFYLSVLVMFLWVVFQLWRYYYFGNLLPNTAFAQKISVLDNLHLFLSGNVDYFKERLYLSARIFSGHAALIILSLMPLLYFLSRKIFHKFTDIDDSIKLVFILSLSIILSSSFAPFIFGEARIDALRTTTHMSLIVFLFIATMLYSFLICYKKYQNPAKFGLRRILLYLIVAAPIIGTYLYYSQHNKPYYLGWSTKDFIKIRNQFVSIAKQHEIRRPTISNPDLGVITWFKKFNVIDLGQLGSPVMAKLSNDQMITDYYLNYGLPDIIEAHGNWILKYCNSIFKQNKFTDLYMQVNGHYNIKSICNEKNDNIMTYWIRRDIAKDSNSPERILLNNLQDTMSTDRIRQEITDCKLSNSDCSYIARTVYKFIPEIRKADEFKNVYEMFASNTDRALLRSWSDGRAHEIIINNLHSNTLN